MDVIFFFWGGSVQSIIKPLTVTYIFILWGKVPPQASVSLIAFAYNHHQKGTTEQT
jgi:hypothetical protein